MSIVQTAIRSLVCGFVLFRSSIGILNADAIVTPEAIVPGKYEIESDPGDKTGEVIVPAYALLRDMGDPAATTEFREILHGAVGAKVAFADGRSLSLADAIRSREVEIRGVLGRRNDMGVVRTFSDKLSIVAPAGSKITLDAPLILSAEPWLQSWTPFAMSEGHLSKVAGLVKTSPPEHDFDVQIRVIDAFADDLSLRPGMLSEFEAAFGPEGVSLLRGLAAKGSLKSVKLSTPGLDPVAHIFATGDEYTSGWISMVDGKLVNRLAVKKQLGAGVDNGELRKLYGENLRRLCPADAAILYRMEEKRWLFVRPGQEPVKELAEDFTSALTGIEAVHAWMAQGEGRRRTLLLASDISKPCGVLNSSGPSDSWLRSVNDQLRSKASEGLTLLQTRDLRNLASRMAGIPKVKSAKEVAVLWGPTGVLPEAKAAAGVALASSGVRLMGAQDETPVSAVIIVGDEETPEFREALARMAKAGRFKGKAVAWLVPSRTISHVFCRFLLEEGGAAAVLELEGRNIPALMDPFLQAVAAAARDIRPSGESLQEFISRAGRVAMADAGRTRLRTFMEQFEGVQVIF
jgi:hypothetical protein